METFALSFLLPVTYILVGVLVLAILFFSIKKLVDNYKKSKRTLLGVEGLLVLWFITYFASNGTTKYLDHYDVSANQEKLIEAGLYTIYLTAIALLVIIVITEVKTALKK